MAKFLHCIGFACFHLSWDVEAIQLTAAGGISNLVEKRNSLFDEFISRFGRTYTKDSEDYVKRASLFAKRVQKIESYNERPNRLWTAGITALTDRTDEEFRRLRGLRPVHRGGGRGSSLLSATQETHGHVPKQVDWDHLVSTNMVFDQGECGSCWAVAAASMMQARYEIVAKKNRTFSVQQLVDCSPNPSSCGGTGGCDGATVELAMEYVALTGLEQEHTVPYTGRMSDCPKPQLTSSPLMGGFVTMDRQLGKRAGGYQVGLQRWNQLPENSALPLMRAAMEGPVAISVAATDWFYYSRGIFDGCPKDAVIDHATTLFGYGTDAAEGQNYWRVRNSWGRHWGENGFIRLFRHNKPDGDDAYCGIDRDPGAGTACKPYPQFVRVCGMCGLLYDSVVAHFAPEPMIRSLWERILHKSRILQKSR